VDPQERRRQILDRSAEIFAEKSIAATTIRQIADAVGVYSGALYHYFPSKDAIVTELIREYIEDLTARCRDLVARSLPPIERIEALATIALETSAEYHGATAIWRREHHYMRKLLIAADMADTADEMEEAWRVAIAEGVADGSLRDDVDPHTLQEMLYDVLWHASRWYTAGPEHTHADLAATIVTVFVDGMRNRAR